MEVSLFFLLPVIHATSQQVFPFSSRFYNLIHMESSRLSFRDLWFHMRGSQPASATSWHAVAFSPESYSSAVQITAVVFPHSQSRLNLDSFCFLMLYRAKTLKGHPTQHPTQKRVDRFRRFKRHWKTLTLTLEEGIEICRRNKVLNAYSFVFHFIDWYQFPCWIKKIDVFIILNAINV